MLNNKLIKRGQNNYKFCLQFQKSDTRLNLCRNETKKLMQYKHNHHGDTRVRKKKKVHL